MPNGNEFERRVGATLDSVCPHSRLSNVLLFRPDLPERRRYGFEIDHLLHIRDEMLDRLIIVECKNQPVVVHGNEWRVIYDGQTHDAKAQLWNQAVSLLRHVADRDSGRQLHIEACIISSHPTALIPFEVGADSRVTFRLFSIDRFFASLSTQRRLVQRIEQSRILTELRQGVAVTELGRPDIANAIAFVTDCRRALDHELFRRFPVSQGMTWKSQAAINGTAGMGKSVMLAYVLFVLSCDAYVEADDSTGSRRLTPLGSRADELGLPAHAKRSIVAFGMSQKQVSVLQALWRHFVRLFGSLENGHLLHFHQPAFRVWDAAIPDECNILVVDEAHDLKIEAQRIVAGWKNESEGDSTQCRYLLVACDRHQRLALDGHGANIIDGLGGGGFASHTLRLRRNYRSPFPVYAASLALMFRWFAGSGPKVIPTTGELEGSFGFRVEPRGNAQPWALTDINDSHPGNHWCYTVSRFLAPQDALRQVRHLRKDDVLWVRFCEEDVFFDYEQLSSFTYHPMKGGGSAALIDKYIKGQEFNVVVIEGLPLDAVAASSSEGVSAPDDSELKMWQARRELYLCASRANVFLFFILKPGQEGEQEIENLLAQVRAPSEAERRLWKLRFEDGRPTRRPSEVDRFSESDAQASHEAASATIITLKIDPPVTINGLVTALQSSKGVDLQTGIRQVLDAVVPLGLTEIRMDSRIPSDRLGDLEEALGVLIDIGTTDREQSKQIIPPAPRPLGQANEAPSGIKSITAGMTVREAARNLHVSAERLLLEALPANYQAGHILEDSDLSRLASWVAKTETTAAPITQSMRAVETTWQSELANHLWQRMQQPDFVRERKMVQRYVKFLSELVRLKPETADILLNFRPRHRPYFARSEAELLKDQPYASALRMSHGGLVAMGTLSNESKLSVLRKILGEIRLPSSDIRRLLGGL